MFFSPTVKFKQTDFQGDDCVLLVEWWGGHQNVWFLFFPIPSEAGYPCTNTLHMNNYPFHACLPARGWALMK